MVREAVLTEVMAPIVGGESIALIVAVLSRLAWLVSELVISGILYLRPADNCPPMLSVVIPVFNEADSLAILHQELSEVAIGQGYELDVVFVDDGSTDGSWEVIRGLAAADPRVTGLRFRRNFGKAAALSRVRPGPGRVGDDAGRRSAGRSARNPAVSGRNGAPRRLKRLEEVRYDPWHKVWPSRAFNWMVSKLTGVKLHDHNCGMKCYRRQVFREVRLYGELHRFVPVLAAARGFRTGEIVIRHRPRKFGHSKYGAMRIVKGFLDLLTVKFLTGFGQHRNTFWERSAWGHLRWGRWECWRWPSGGSSRVSRACSRSTFTSGQPSSILWAYCSWGGN